ncbi:hypothetical protein AAGS61_15455 [Lysinibacillus sp. KU-BSD001]
MPVESEPNGAESTLHTILLTIKGKSTRLKLQEKREWFHETNCRTA